MVSVNGVNGTNLYGAGPIGGFKSGKAEVGNLWSGYSTPTIAGTPPAIASNSPKGNAVPTYVMGNTDNHQESITSKEMANVLDLKSQYSSIPEEKRTDEQKTFLKDYDSALGNMKELNQLVNNYASLV